MLWRLAEFGKSRYSVTARFKYRRWNTIKADDGMATYAIPARCRPLLD
nr:hypothetical protein JVH1_0403 [Rhodococcus sp. JVH1]